MFDFFVKIVRNIFKLLYRLLTDRILFGNKPAIKSFELSIESKPVTLTMSEYRKLLEGLSFKTFYVRQIEPELWLHMQIPDDCYVTDAQIYSLRSNMESQIRKVFKQKYDVNVELEVSVEEGSIRAKIKVTAQSIVLIIIAYGGIRQGIDYISKDITSIWHKAVPEIVQVADDVFLREDNVNNYITRIIAIQQHKGVIEKLDEAFEKYKRGIIKKEQCIEELSGTFEVIQSSDVAKTLARALVKYINLKYPDTIPWDDLKAILRKKEDEDDYEQEKYQWQ